MPDFALINSLPQERRRILQEILVRDGRVTIQKIVQDFAVSEDTARRDLKELEATGLCTYVYGGALLARDVPAAEAEDVGQRRKMALDRKDLLGKVLGGLVQPGQVVFVDTGTTNLAAARYIPDLADVTVITHDPAIAAALVPFQNIRLISIGGRINRSVGAAIDAAAMRSIKNVNPDLLILGTCAIDIQKGLSAFSYEDAEIKSMLVENAGEVATGILNEKLGSAAPYGICALSGLNTLVLEADASPDMLENYQRAVPKLLVAEAAKGNRF